MDVALTTTGDWWSYAEGDRTVLGVVVVIVIVAAAVFVGLRVWHRLRGRR